MRAVFDAVEAVRDKGLNVDEITISDELKAKGRQGYIAFMAGIDISPAEMLATMPKCSEKRRGSVPWRPCYAMG